MLCFVNRKEKEINNFISALDHTLNMNNRRPSATDEKSDDDSGEGDGSLVDEIDAIAEEEEDEVILLHILTELSFNKSVF